jgi:hypothetical protein
MGDDGAYGQWAGLANIATKHVLAAAGLPGGGLAAELVATMAGLGEAQAQLLASIKKDTKLLREEPFRTARTLLGEARRVGPDDPRHGDFVDRALESFYRAHSLAQSAREQAVVEFDIALLYLVTGKAGDALHWMDRSRASCRVAVDDLVSGWILPRDPLSDRIQDKRRSARRDLRASLKRAGTEATVAFVSAGTGVMAVTHSSRQRRRAEAIAAARDMVAFSNLVEHLTARAHDGAAPHLLVIVDEPKQRVALREVPEGRP